MHNDVICCEGVDLEPSQTLFRYRQTELQWVGLIEEYLLELKRVFLRIFRREAHFSGGRCCRRSQCASSCSYLDRSSITFTAVLGVTKISVRSRLDVRFGAGAQNMYLFAFANLFISCLHAWCVKVRPSGFYPV